jgi:hypothetical protein
MPVTDLPKYKTGSRKKIILTAIKEQVSVIVESEC